MGKCGLCSSSMPAELWEHAALRLPPRSVVRAAEGPFPKPPVHLLSGNVWLIGSCVYESVHAAALTLLAVQRFSAVRTEAPQPACTESGAAVSVAPPRSIMLID